MVGTAASEDAPEKPAEKNRLLPLKLEKKRKKSLTKRAFKRHRVLSGYATLYWRGGSLVEGN